MIGSYLFNCIVPYLLSGGCFNLSVFTQFSENTFAQESCFVNFINLSTKVLIQFFNSFNFKDIMSIIREQNVLSYVVSIIKHVSDDCVCTEDHVTNE